MLAIISQVMERTVTKYLNLAYSLYLPSSYELSGDKTWPVVFFLHGAGERGNDLTLLAKQGLVRQASQGQEFPFILVAPQCPENQTWDRNLDHLDGLFQEILDRYAVERERIYLTGLSMGGYGTWHWASRHPHAFAALAPICGGTMPLLGFPQRVTALKHVPIWVFHGEDDEVVPIVRSEELVLELEKVGAPVRFTRYPGVGHNSWDPAYQDAAFIPWLLQQRNLHFSFEEGGHVWPRTSE